MSRRTVSIASLAMFYLFVFLMPIQAAGPSAVPTTYKWIAEFVAADTGAKTITIKARIPDFAAKYMDRFKAGDHLTLVWNMLPPRPEGTGPTAKTADAAKPTAPEGTAPPADKAASDATKAPSSGAAPQSPAVQQPIQLKTESDLLLIVEPYSKTSDTGYILPAEFVAFDAQTVTVKLHLSEKTLQSATAMKPGTRVRATSSMSQPTEVADVSEMTAAGGGEAAGAGK